MDRLTDGLISKHKLCLIKIINKQTGSLKKFRAPKIFTEILDNRYTDVVSLLQSKKKRKHRFTMKRTMFSASQNDVSLN